MSELAAKPFEFRPGRQISTEGLNQILRSVPRVITGDGVEMKRIGDRWIVERRDDYVYASSDLQNFVVLSEEDDYLICVMFSFTSTPQAYQSDLGVSLQDLGLTGTEVYVAKPYWLQQTPYIGKKMHINGVDVNLTFPSIGFRDYAPVGGGTIQQTITPSYFSGDVIVARSGPTGISVGDQQVEWMDLNNAARIWSSPSSPNRALFLHRFPGPEYTVNIDTNAVLSAENDSLDVDCCLVFSPPSNADQLQVLISLGDGNVIFDSGVFTLALVPPELSYSMNIKMVMTRAIPLSGNDVIAVTTCLMDGRVLTIVTPSRFFDVSAGGDMETAKLPVFTMYLDSGIDSPNVIAFRVQAIVNSGFDDTKGQVAYIRGVEIKAPS